MLVYFLAVLPFLAFHELGHVLAARGLGLRPFGCGCVFVPRDPHAFEAIPLGRRTLISLMGPLLAYACGFLVLTGVFLRDYSRSSRVINDVIAGLPAADAGLQPGDGVVTLDGEPLEDGEALKAGIRPRASKRIQVEVRRGGETKRVELTPTPRPDGTVVIGVRLQSEMAKRSLWEAAGLAVSMPFSTISKLYGFDTEPPNGTGQIVSPVEETSELRARGDVLLVWAAANSMLLSLGFLLPIPGLDGGNLLLLGVERLTGWRPSSVATRRWRFVLLLALGVYIAAAMAQETLQSARTQLGG